MSCQTGIRVFSTAEYQSKDGNIRAIKVSIENDKLTSTGTFDVKEDWEKDYDEAIKPFIEDEIPCYILYRLDEKTSSDYAWLLLNWVPDDAPVRQKMLYASTKATLKTEFGGTSRIRQEIHATSIRDTTLIGYNKTKKLKAAPAPLTNLEVEKEFLRKAEIGTHTEVCANALQQTLKGIGFPLTEEAITAIEELKNGTHNYLQFEVLVKEEKINIVKSETITVDKLRKQVPRDNPRYHVFKFKHNHEGINQEPYVFVYSMPGYIKVSVKERMLYSSCKAPLIEVLTSHGIEISKKMEVDTGNDLAEESLLEVFHPKRVVEKQPIVKPKLPPGVGPMLMIKLPGMDPK